MESERYLLNYLGLEVGLIWCIQGLDMAYWGFLGYSVLSFIPLWSLACSFMLCDLDFEPLSLSLSSMPSCDLVSLLILKLKSEFADVSVFVCLRKQLLGNQPLNLTVHCCGQEFRVLNGYDQKSFDEERGLN
ncbi:hypothetical protein Tco_0502526 [Tanacetum coccineum]